MNGFTQDHPNEADSAEKPQPGFFGSLIEIWKKYKEGIFGKSSKKPRRSLDYSVKPSTKFVLAKYYEDGSYRPAEIISINKRKQNFIVSFYFDKECRELKPSEVNFKHNNLYMEYVTFHYYGKILKGKVMGNNSPTNKGFPAVFFVKIKEKWYNVPIRNIFLSKKQYYCFSLSNKVQVVPKEYSEEVRKTLETIREEKSCGDMPDSPMICYRTDSRTFEDLEDVEMTPV